MARIPQYNRNVTPQNTPYEYIKAPARPEAFGLGVSSAMGNLGDSALGALDVAASLKQQYDKTKLLEFGNTIDEWVNNTLYDKDNGYFYKTGKEAMGKSPELMESYDKYVDELLGSAGFVGGYANAARRIAASKRITTENNIERHDRQETDKWQDTVYSDSFSNIFNKALQNRNDPDALQMYYRDAMTVFDNYALIKGWNNDPEMMEIKRKEFGGNFHATILDAYLAEGSLKALDYFEEHKESFDPETQNKYLQRIQSEKIDYTARTNAQALLGYSPEEAYNYINSIENIEERNSVESEYNRLLRQQKAIQDDYDRQKSNEIMQKVYMAFDNGEDISSIMREVNVSDMSLEQKEKIYKNLKTMQELKGVGNNWADYNILMDMSAFNNEEFKNVNLANYDLTKEQYQELTDMQRKAANNEYTPENEMRKAINGLLDSNFNWQGGNGLHSKEYEDEVVRFLSKVERMQGKAFDIKNKEQLQAIMEGFNWKNPDEKNQNIDEVKELFTRAQKHGEAWDIMAREYMMFKGANKREPSKEEIYDMAKRTYNTIETEWKQRDMGKLNEKKAFYRDINGTIPKKGETKALTYFADVDVPRLSRELGFPLTVTSRYRAGDPGGHGKGRKCDVDTASLSMAQKEQLLVALLTRPNTASIGLSDDYLLNKYNKPLNPKIRDLREYDQNYNKAHPGARMSHKTHFDISLDINYGGAAQGRGKDVPITPAPNNTKTNPKPKAQIANQSSDEQYITPASQKPKDFVFEPKKKNYNIYNK